VDEDPPWLVLDPEGPPPEPPVMSRAAELPFDRLEWRNFERLCRRLAERGGDVEKVYSYGKPGQAQGGIDILVRLVDATYEVWQVKRYRRMTPAQVNGIVDLFLRHEWKAKAKKLVLAVACDLESTGNVTAIEEANRRLANEGILFESVDSFELTQRLVAQPDIIDDFFDRPWVEAVCPPEAIEALARRLSRFAAADLRRSLRDWFTAWVRNVDPGLPVAHLGHDGRVAPSIPIGERYVQPDFLVRTIEPATSPSAQHGEEKAPGTSGDPVREDGASQRRLQTGSPLLRERRVEADRFLAGEHQVLISADAGMGKSTLLRVIALDMLSGWPKLTAVRDLEGFIPVWVPFALWTRMASDRAAPPPLEEAVREFYRAQSEPELGEGVARALGTSKVILLIDGLDEAIDATAARTVAALLATFVETRGLAALATSRPHGQGLAGFGGRWARVEIAPLSDAQRHALPKLWFKVIGGLEAAEQPAAKLDAQAERRASGLGSALMQNASVARLSQTPLFLLALMQLYRHQQELPRSRFAAVEKIIEELVEHQPRRRETEALTSKGVAGIKPMQRDRVLDHLALALHSGELTGPVTDAATEADAIAHAARFLMQRQGSQDLDAAEETARSILAFAEERAGLFVKKASGAIGFLHLSIQEFLAARHLAQRSFSDRLAFVRENAERPRWREPILYLLYLENNEGQVGELVEAIAQARVSSAEGRYHFEALLTDAVFSDFAHNIAVSTPHAQRLLDKAELTGWGKQKRHIVQSAVDGLGSEAVGALCAEKIALWVPNRHGYARAGVFRAMPGWPSSTQADCRKVLLRSLGSDEESVRQAAAEVLATIAEPGGRTKAEIVALLEASPSVTVMATALYALGCGWAHDDDVGQLAAVARSCPDPRIAREALRIRVERNETDEDDFEEFFRLIYSERLILGLGRMAERGLIDHFAQTRREDFMLRLVNAIERNYRRKPVDLRLLVGSLILCDPTHPLVEPGLKDLLEHDWHMREIFADSGFPSDRIIWTPALEAEIERFVAGPNRSFHHYEIYWIAKAHPVPLVKSELLRQVSGDNYFRFWSAQALIEVWGPDDPEVRAALLGFLDRSGEDIAPIAEALPAVCNDKQVCRSALLRALQSEAKDVRHTLRGLRALGIANDDEIFAAGVEVSARLRAPLYESQWREQMVLTFPERPEVRRIAWEELHRRDGEIGAVAQSYARDTEMTSEMLRVLAPLPEAETSNPRDRPPRPGYRGCARGPDT
jgi:hypothetical protein